MRSIGAEAFIERGTMAVKITNFRTFSKNTLLGFFNILLTNVGLEIRDATLHEKNGKRWICLPAKPYQDEAGETKYSYIIKFMDREKSDQFQTAVLKALDAFNRTSR